MEPSRIYSVALATSAIIFLGHKIEDRFTDKPGKSCAPDHPESWKCKFPGQIVSHKPWDWKTGCCVTFIYVLIGVIVTLGVSKLAFAVEASKTLWTPATVGFVLFSLFWIAWGAWETHHQKKTHNRMMKNKTMKRGTPFSCMFTKFIFFVYLPITLWFLSKQYDDM